MTNGFQLPGAERFSRYLEERLGGVLTAECPEILSEDDSCKIWIVRHNGEQLGEYRAYSPMPGETDFVREFDGRIPVYINECRAITNRHVKESERVPENRVSLRYDNKRNGVIEIKNRDYDEDVNTLHKGHYKEVDTPWQRQDNHDIIPFP